jgi:hypothetical protein
MKTSLVRWPTSDPWVAWWLPEQPWLCGGSTGPAGWHWSRGTEVSEAGEGRDGGVQPPLGSTRLPQQCKSIGQRGARLHQRVWAECWACGELVWAAGPNPSCHATMVPKEAALCPWRWQRLTGTLGLVGLNSSCWELRWPACFLP